MKGRERISLKTSLIYFLFQYIYIRIPFTQKWNIMTRVFWMRD